MGQTNSHPLPRGFWALGIVSMLTDISSEMVSGLLPVFLVTVVGASLLVLVAADALLAFGGLGIWGGIALWGLHMAMAQGLISALLANAAPADLRGTAFGLYYLVSGIALLIASVLAGVLWDQLGPAAPFIAGAVISLLALLLIWMQPAVFKRI